jgi:hypothetical protein
MNREIRFYHALQENRMRIQEYQQKPDLMRAVIYIDSACALADAFEIKDFPVKPMGTAFDGLSEIDVRGPLFELERYVAHLRARNIFELDGHLKEEYVELDDDWRSKAIAYVQRVRSAVRKAEMEEALRESILKRVNELQSEIERNRTRFAALAEVWLAATEAAGKGATNLEPVFRRLEKLGGAFSWLRKVQNDQEPKRLPPPETMGLPDPNEDQPAGDPE